MHAHTPQGRRVQREHTYMTVGHTPVLLLEQRNKVGLTLKFYSIKSDLIVLVDWWSVRVRRHIALYFFSAASLLGVHSSQVSLLGKNNTLPLPFKRESLLLCTEHELFFFFLNCPRSSYSENCPHCFWWMAITHILYHWHQFEPVHWAVRGEGHSVLELHLHFQ